MDVFNNVYNGGGRLIQILAVGDDEGHAVPFTVEHDLAQIGDDFVEVNPGNGDVLRLIGQSVIVKHLLSVGKDLVGRLIVVEAELVYEQEVNRDKALFESRFGLTGKSLGVRPESGSVAQETETLAEPDPLLEELYQELLRRNRVLYENHQSSLTDPFPYEQPTIDLSAYGVPDNTIGYLTIPRMDLVVPILLGANTDNMRLGAVHLTETSYPIGGENTNCILAAHRGMGTKAMFREIKRMEIGDLLYIENFRETLTYRVVELRVIEPTDIDQLLIQEGRDLITLVTCHPYRHNYQRYVVLCERVEQESSVG